MLNGWLWEQRDEKRKPKTKKDGVEAKYMCE